MRRDLERSSNLAPSSELINRWVDLSDAGKYDHVVAIKTAGLNQTHIDRLAKYNQIEDILEDIDNQIVIASAMHYLGEKYTLGHMELLINSVFNFVKVGKAIEAFVMPELCRMILDEFGLWITFADLKLCLRRGISNKYGTTYDRLDAQVLFSWMDQYRTERFHASEHLKREKLRKRAAEDKGTPMPEEIKRKLEDLENKLKQQSEQVHSEYEPTLSKGIEHLRT
jgi:hypothetical protein